ncbi:hypothetical protein IGI04_031360 [Brassica rapa subsp. trilocularis]|uniref:Protein FAR1-RELATED SEQUENCE n=1 Tax=Brassica rapa subsp. trilocularis TaxID=1813537 RepID=A0ABQ7LWP3_BRACM|nr:hypothetical protein IGI04_031360 [Brassica rapa subsp. trilocularis]
MSLEHVLNYLKRKHLENPSFSYALEDEDNVGNVFWADPTCRLNYTHFGDTLVFDTTYLRNSQVPFAAFTGFNHHGHPLLFGCALILNQSQSSFAWLFHSWLQAMSSPPPPPPSITLEPDPVIHLAASQVFPQARLRFSLPLIMEKLAHVFGSHPGFQSEFLSCVRETETVAEFEGAWDSVVRRYCLEEDHWLQSIYNVRQQWVPVFIKDTFFGELSSENKNSFFHGFVDGSTTMEMVMIQCEEAEAKSSSEFSNSGCQESLTVCYDNLRQEATKYVEEGAKSIQVYKAAVVALDEAAKKVAAASSKTRGGATNGDSYQSDETQETANGMYHPLQCQGEKERTILELTAELERTGQRCEAYRANLLSILRDMEEHKFQLSLKVQNARLSLKE